MRKNKGFTLIELLVVIAIIGLLSSIVLASLNSARKKSRDARRVADIKQLQVALEMYFDANNGSYPPGTSLTTLAPTYISSLPKDPLGTDYRYQAINNITNGAACSSTTTSCTYYHLGASLEDNTNAALKSDADVCTAVNPPACVRALPGTTINGNDAAPCNSGDIGSYCYDVTP